MSQSSIGYSAVRFVLFAALFQCFALACDPTSPIDASRQQVPGQAAYGLQVSGLSATAVSWDRIDISWATVQNASGYQVFRSTTGTTGSYELVANTSATVTTYANTGLTGSTQYCYQIRSIKTAGRNISYSAFSSPACATTLAPPVVAPSGTDVTPLASVIQIKWQDNSSDESGFHIEQASAPTGSWGQVTNVGANTTSAVWYPSPEHQQCFRVIAFNAIGPSLASTPDCTTMPATPTNVVAKAADLQSINVTWTDNSAAEDGYKVSKLVGGVWTDLATLSANVTTYRDAGLSTDIAYTYRVQALKDGGYTEVSQSAVGVIPTTAPIAPWGTQAYYHVEQNWVTGFYTGDIQYLQILWQDASTNEEGFRVEYSPDGLSGWNLYGTTNADIPSLWTRASGSDPSLPSGCYRVSAFNAIGASHPSNIACVEPGVVPTDLSATAVDEQTIDLTWTDNAKLEIGYEVLHYFGDEYGNVSYEVVADLPPDTHSYRETGLVSGSEYDYYVVALYAGGTSGGLSNSAFAMTPTSAAPVSSSPTRMAPRAGPAHPDRVKRLPSRLLPGRDSRKKR